MKSINKTFIISILSILTFTFCNKKHVASFTKSKTDLMLLDSVDRDNKIYTVGTKMVFDYYFIKNQDTLKVLLLDDMPYREASSWVLAKADTVSENAKKLLIRKMTVEILKNSLYSGEDAQTNAQFVYLNDSNQSLLRIWTGIIEDENKVWWHPFRAYHFFATEFSPFPEIRTPFEIGTSWNDTIRVGKSTESLEWVNDFEGNVLPVNSHYKITKKKKINTAFGELKCWVVAAKAINQFNEATLTSYFHEEYGFVRWDYVNIDGIRLVIDLVDFE